MPLPPPDVSDPFLGVHALSVVLWYSSQCVFPPPAARCSWVAVTVWGGERLGSVLETAVVGQASNVPGTRWSG